MRVSKKGEREMPSKEYIRLITMGQWIEKYLNPDIKIWEYRELARDSSEIYDLGFGDNYKITPEYALPEMVRFIEEQSKEDKTFYKKGLNVDLYRVIGEGKDHLNLVGQGVMPEILGSSQEGNHNIKRHLQKCAERCLEVYRFQGLTKQLFKRISTLERWEDAFLSDGTDNVYSYSEILTHYSKLHQKIGIDNNLRDVRILNSIVESQIKTKLEDGSLMISMLDSFPWCVIVSRMVLDYLFAGGKDYFAFCQYCGKFSSGKRKGEKKFCSNNCRSMHRHKMKNNYKT